MNNLIVFKVWPALAVLSLLLIFSACTKDDDPAPTQSSLLQGTWRCTVSGGTNSGDWDELIFNSSTEITRRFYDASTGGTDSYLYSYVASETTLFFTYKKDESQKYASSYTIKGDELTFNDFIDGSDYLYKKQK